MTKRDRNKIILESLSMDLLRVALGYHRGSIKMAETFQEEALKRKNEVDIKSVKPYIKTHLSNMEKTLLYSDTNRKAEDALMYSTLFRNYCTVNLLIPH